MATWPAQYLSHVWSKTLGKYDIMTIKHIPKHKTVYGNIEPIHILKIRGHITRLPPALLEAAKRPTRVQKRPYILFNEY